MTSSVPLVIVQHWNFYAGLSLPFPPVPVCRLFCVINKPCVSHVWSDPHKGLLFSLLFWELLICTSWYICFTVAKKHSRKLFHLSGAAAASSNSAQQREKHIWFLRTPRFQDSRLQNGNQITSNPSSLKNEFYKSTQTMVTDQGGDINFFRKLETEPRIHPSPLIPTFVVSNTNRDFTNDSVPEAGRRMATQKVVHLELILVKIANYCPIISRNTIVRNFYWIKISDYLVPLWLLIHRWTLSWHRRFEIWIQRASLLPLLKKTP